MDTKFKPGNPGKKKGTKNRAATRAKLADWINNNWTRFDEEMMSVKGKNFCELFIKVLPFMMPAYQSINFSLSNMNEDDLEFLIDQLKSQMNHGVETVFDSGN